VLLIKTNPNNQLQFHPESEEIATDFLSDEETIDLMIDFSNLKEDELKPLLCDLSKQYEIQMKDEIKCMTDIVDPEHSNKTPAEAAKMKSEMTKSFNVSDYFIDIQKDVMNVILQK